jgi:hypothetical protein
MSREVKITLGILAAVFSIVFAGFVAFLFAWSRSMSAAANDPVARRATVEKIATLTIPRGYKIRDAIDMGFAQMATIVPAGREHRSFHIQLQGSGAMTAEAQNRRIRGSLGMIDRKMHCGMVDGGVDRIVVRGMTVGLRVILCSNPAVPNRMEIGTFPGNGASAVISANGSTADFDTAALHALLKSVR